MAGEVRQQPVPLTEAELEWTIFAFRTYDVSSLTTEEIKEVDNLRERYAAALQVIQLRRRADTIERRNVYQIT